MKVIRCQFDGCGKKFLPGSGRAKYCNECKPLARQIAIQRCNDGKKKQPKVAQCVYKGCGKVFQAKREDAKYCGECREKERKREKNGIRVVVCQFDGCGKEFKTKGRSAKFCDDCRPAAVKLRDKIEYATKKRNLKRYDKICKVCSIEFITNNPHTICCSEECKTITEKERAQKYYQDNKEAIKIVRKAYEENNKDAIRTSRNKSDKKRRETDPAYRLMSSFSGLMARGLKTNGSSKNRQSCWKLAGYSREMFRKHIEQGWSRPENLDENGKVWMNWSNYGAFSKNRRTWQLDHIIPQSDLLFKSFDEPSFKKCWALENLRPLEAERNLLDGVHRTRHNKKKAA